MGNQKITNNSRKLPLFSSPFFRIPPDRTVQPVELEDGLHILQVVEPPRILMTNPALILLDEPGEGLAPLVIRAMEKQLGKIKKLGLTMLICEYNIGLALALSDRGYVMDKGTIRYQGTIKELRKNEEVRKRYLMV